MSRDRNEACIVGTIHRAPQFFAGPGTPRLQLVVVTVDERTDKNGGGTKVSTPWHRCTIWGEKAEKYRDLQSGDRVALWGKIHYSRVPGKEGTVAEIHCYAVEPGELAAEEVR